jgi:hypothetical protein
MEVLQWVTNRDVWNAVKETAGSNAGRNAAVRMNAGMTAAMRRAAI